MELFGKIVDLFYKIEDIFNKIMKNIGPCGLFLERRF